VQGHDVLAMGGLIASAVLGWRLEGGTALFVTSIALGLVLYVGLLLARRRIHVELGLLMAIGLAAFIIGGGHLLHPAHLGAWATLFVVVGPMVALSLLWAFFNRDRSE
jgi:hypothetical protein